MKEERDTQRSKLYKAEREAFQENVVYYPEMDDMAQYVAKTLSRAPIKARYADDFGKNRLQIKDGRRRSSAGGCDRFITIPRAMRKDWVILHELAHALTQRKYGYYVAAHGWQFAAIYIDLIHFMKGKDAADALKASFRKNRVRWRPKQKRVATPEQIARLTAAREAHKLTKMEEAA